MINVCKACHHGYAQGLHDCPWCGTGEWFSTPAERPVRMLDTECYRDYWLCKLDNPIQEFEMYPGQMLDRDTLHAELSKCTIVTFNGNAYDVPMIAAAFAGHDNAHLKQASDEIIVGSLQPWQFYDRWKLEAPTWIDHIDMIEVKPGQGSLKILGGKMHSRKLQDLPVEPSDSIRPEDRPVLREYCGNDLETTRDLFNTFPAQIRLREQMSEEYGLDLRSKSDAQIAEAIMRKLTGVKQRVPVAGGTAFYYRPAPWLKFQCLPLLDLLARSPFMVTHSSTVTMTEELSKYHIRIGRSVYHMGIGGLHSTESGQVHIADDTYSLQDVDVASYYPRLILITGIVPVAIGSEFVKIYQGWYERRLAAKHAGDKKTADSLKTLLNGTFGKLGSPWSIFYAPSEMIQVTVTGQLALLMLIEMLEACGIGVVSANTDGIVIKCRRDMEWMRDQIVQWWRELTGFETEAVDYAWIAARDVNNYVAQPADLSKPPKLKGAYARPLPVATSWPNPSGEVCIDAVCDYLTKRADIETTIRACQDIRKFVHIRSVSGGGKWKDQFLGKAVRWYFATGDTAPILYSKNGNRVANTDGCRPIMELPDMLPIDINYARYASDTRAMLADLGIQL